MVREVPIVVNFENVTGGMEFKMNGPIYYLMDPAVELQAS